MGGWIVRREGGGGGGDPQKTGGGGGGGFGAAVFVCVRGALWGFLKKKICNYGSIIILNFR
eukprot:SAG31_NODE_3378_length_4344_cov_7.620259_5_plen_60_part_01